MFARKDRTVASIVIKAYLRWSYNNIDSIPVMFACYLFLVWFVGACGWSALLICNILLSVKKKTALFMIYLYFFFSVSTESVLSPCFALYVFDNRYIIFNYDGNQSPPYMLILWSGDNSIQQMISLPQLQERDIVGKSIHTKQGSWDVWQSRNWWQSW